MKKIKNYLWFILLVLLFVFSACKKTEYCFELNYDVVNPSSEQITKFTVKDKETMPNLPSPENDWYGFDGWYAKKGSTEFKVHDGKNYLVDDGVFIKDNYSITNNKIILTAKYLVNKVNCFIDIEGNNVNYQDKTHQLFYGDILPSLPKLSSEYAVFLGWYTMKNGKEVLIHNGIDYLGDYAIYNEKNYEITNFTSKIYAKYNKRDIRVKLQTNSSEMENSVINIAYGSSISDLPVVPKQYHKFIGWYTIKNGQEYLVSDQNGFLSGRNVLSTETYEIENEEINIYAKFEVEKIKVVLKHENNESSTSTIIEVPYGESITKYAKDVIINGKAVTKWSKKMNDNLFEEVYVGPVTENNIVLYPAENIYYVIKLIDVNVSEVYGMENEKITLPILTKENHEFLGWKDENNQIHQNQYTINQSVSLTAVYLKVGKVSINISSQTHEVYSINDSTNMRDWSDTAQIKNYYDWQGLIDAGYKGFKVSVTLNMNVKNDGYQHIFIYNNEIENDTYLLTSKKYEYDEGNYTPTFNFSVEIDQIPNGYLCLRYAASGYFAPWYSSGNHWYCSNVVVTIEPYK